MTNPEIEDDMLPPKPQYFVLDVVDGLHPDAIRNQMSIQAALGDGRGFNISGNRSWVLEQFKNWLADQGIIENA